MIRNRFPKVGQRPYQTWLALALLALIGLLCACSPSTRQDPADAWQLSEPQFERAGQKSRLPLSQTSSEFADVDDRLIFDPKNSDDQLTGEARCLTESGTILEGAIEPLSAVSSNLLRLIPRNFLQRMSAEPTSSPLWTCTWRLTVTSASGSSHRFRLPAQRIKFRDLNPSTTPVSVSRVELLCPSWSSSIERPLHLARAIAELPSLDVVDGTDDRHQIRQGTCVLMTESSTGHRNLVVRHQWKLPPPQVDVNVQATGSFQPESRPLTEVFRVRVSNREEFPVWIEYKSEFQARLLGESLTTSNQWLASHHTPVAVLPLLGPTPIILGDRHRLRLGPKEEIQLSMRVSRSLFCHGDRTRRLGLMSLSPEAWGLRWVEHAEPERAVDRPTRPIGPLLRADTLWTRHRHNETFVELPDPTTQRQAPCSDRELGATTHVMASDD